MINMVNKNEAIAFSINREKATLAGIEFSSRLLKHADKIVGGGQ